MSTQLYYEAAKVLKRVDNKETSARNAVLGGNYKVIKKCVVCVCVCVCTRRVRMLPRLRAVSG